MSYNIDVRPAALQDQADVGDYRHKATFDADLTERWFDAGEKEIDYALEYPTQTPPIPDMPMRPEGPLRRRIITGFKNYVIFYRFDDKAVTITRILHGSRDLRRVPDL